MDDKKCYKGNKCGHLQAKCPVLRAKKGRAKMESKKVAICSRCQDLIAGSVVQDTVNCAPIQEWIHREDRSPPSTKLLRSLIIPEHSCLTVDVDLEKKVANRLVNQMYYKYHKHYGAFVTKQNGETDVSTVDHPLRL